ncbi:MAG TPA: precorrin-3B C(17)-methyltransferase [Gemmataceae bacterium]|jgi:precorrin-2 C(20)-methyltransferase|nr:precorrin-3B C(17)-methyltransferase [Gemmataceae bacterium]
MATGRFWAVGVGPGDPELLTLKAVNVLRRAHVIYHAGPHEKQGRAWDIVRALVRADQEVRVVLAERKSALRAADWKAHYGPGAEKIAADCRGGLDVAFVTEGDPTLYSTAACVWQLLREISPEIPIEVVPGVSSITAAAARVGWPLAQKDEMLAVVPAGYHADELGALMEQFRTVCLLKPASVLPRIGQQLRVSGPRHEAVYVEELGTDLEYVTQDWAVISDRKNYFSLLIVRQVPEERGAADKQPLMAAGKVCVVGLGPGDPALLTAQALAALRQAEVVIGYEAYLRMLAPLGLQAEVRGSPIGAEAERAAQVLELAREGRRVALVSSGDAGVYGMASLLLETAESMPDIEIDMVPGVTAATAAAARLGAPLGHDFACISLSDLLTPWEVIERRLAAAAQGDFVIAVYNPVSRRRTWQLPRAREVMLQYRAADTSVGLVDKAYRPGERSWQTTLGGLSPEGVGMETTLIIGNSQTRVIHGRIVTPRGYSQGSGVRGQESGVENSVGRRIMEQSLAIIERELGPLPLPAWAVAVVRRMIHASADFEFARTLRYSADLDMAVHTALRGRAAIVTDTEMVLVGIRAALAAQGDLPAACYLNHAETLALAASAGLTRSAAGIRVAARGHPAAVLAIGNAPTALDEALRLVEEEGWRPAAIIGLPVGFVGVEEAKRRLLEQSRVPYLSCTGRKGGSAVTSAAVNALVECLVP